MATVEAAAATGVASARSRRALRRAVLAAVDREDDQGGPDEGVGDDLRAGKLFAVVADGQDELDRGAEVLHEAEGGEGEAAGGDAVEGERRGGEEAAEHEQQEVAGVGVGRFSRRREEAGEEHVDAAAKGEHEQFHDESFDGGNLLGAADQGVEAPRRADAQPQPRRDAAGEDQDQHARARDAEADQLQAAELFAQDEDAEAGHHERGDEVGERALQDLAADDAVDEAEPVDRQQDGGDRQEDEGFGVAEQRFEARPAAREQEQGGDQRQRPDGAVGDDAQRRDVLDGLEEDDDEAPDALGDQGGGESDQVVARAGGGGVLQGGDGRR